MAEYSQRFGTTTLRGQWCQWACKGSEYGDLGSDCGAPGSWSDPTFFGRKIGGVPTVAVDAYHALERALISEGYEALSVWSYNCRPIVSSGNLSLHGFGIAVDIDPSDNPQADIPPYSGKFTEAQVEAAMGIKVAGGQSAWWWGGFWSGSTTPDLMHWQLDCTPQEALAIDWLTVPGGDTNGGDDDLANLSGEAQSYFQAIYDSLQKDPDTPSPGDSNPPGAKLFSYLTSLHRWAVKKTGLPGTEYDQIVARWMDRS